MISLILDPYVLTLPESNRSIDQIEKWWATATSWLDELQASSLEWRQIYRCTEVLLLEERFIGFEGVRRLQRESGADLDPSAVRLLARLLQNGDRDYHAVARTQFVISRTDFSVDPVMFIDRNVDQLQEPLQIALACLAVDRVAGEEFALGARLIGSPEFLSGQGVIGVCIDGSVALVDPDELQAYLPNEWISTCFDLLSSPVQLAYLDCREIYEAGEFEFLGYVEKTARLMNVGEPLRCKFHSSFVSSLEQSSISADHSGMSNLVRRCAEVLTGVAQGSAGANLRQIRTTSSGNSPQLIRRVDDAGAWRVTVSKSGVGWRLNFWQIPPSNQNDRVTVEFAWVQHETDPVHIPE